MIRVLLIGALFSGAPALPREYPMPGRVRIGFLTEDERGKPKWIRLH